MFAAFRYRDFRLYWAGHALSNTGTWMEMLGQGWLVVLLAVADGSPQLAPLYLGLTGLARAVPGLALGLLAGAVADRVDRRRLLMVTQAAGIVPGLVLFGLAATGTATIGAVVLAAALRSAFFAFDFPLRQAMVPRLVPPRDLMSAIGLTQAGTNAPQILGPAVGGVLIVLTGGVAVLFLVNALSYVAIVIALALMRSVPVAPTGRTASIGESVREGLAYTKRDPVILWTMILVAAVAFFARPYMFLIPAFAADILSVGATELSWLMAATGVGGLSGALLVASLGSASHRGRLLLLLSTAAGASVTLFTMQRTLQGALILAVFVGLTAVAFNGVSNTTLQTMAPARMLGRVMSLFAMTFIVVIPLGQLALGAVGTLLQIDVALLIGGVVTVGVAAYVALRVPAIRELRTVVLPEQVIATAADPGE